MVKYKVKKSLSQTIFFEKEITFFLPERPPTGSNWIIQMGQKVALFYQVDDHSFKYLSSFI